MGYCINWLYNITLDERNKNEILKVKAFHIIAKLLPCLDNFEDRDLKINLGDLLKRLLAQKMNKVIKDQIIESDILTVFM